MASYKDTSGTVTKKIDTDVTLTLYWSYTQNAINNKSLLYVKLIITYKGYIYLAHTGTIEAYRRLTDTYILNESFDIPTVSSILTEKSLVLLEKTFDIPHESNGFGNADIGINCFGTSIDIGTVYFAKIDRTAPTVSFKAVPLTTYADISVTTNSECDVFQYSTDNGSTWNTATTIGDIAFTQNTTSASFRIAGLSKETSYNVKVRARRKYNQVYGTSAVGTVKTIGRTTVSSIAMSDADVETVTAKITAVIYDSGHYHKMQVLLGNTLVFVTNAFQMTCNNNVNEQKVNTVTSSISTYEFTAAERTKLLKAMTKLTGATLTFRLYTYSNSDCTLSFGYVVKDAYTKTTAANSKPSFVAFSYEDSNAVTKAVTGNNQVLIQTYSNLLVTCSAGTAKNGATIVKYEASIGKSYANSTGTSLDVGAVNEKDEQTLTVTCIDSRGYSVTLTKTIRVIPYNDPYTMSFTLRRRDNVGELVQLSFRGYFSPVDAVEGTDTNGLTYARFRYKNTSEEEYSEWTSLLDILTLNGNTFSYETNELMELDAEKSYMFHFQIRDKLGEHSSYDYYVVLEQGIPVIAIRGRSNAHDKPFVGINNPNPQYPLDVGGLIAMNGSVVLGYGGVLAEGETIRSKSKGGIYKYDASYEALDAPEKVPAIVMAVSAGDSAFIMFVTLSSCNVYVTSYSGSSWSPWKQL